MSQTVRDLPRVWRELGLPRQIAAVAVAAVLLLAGGYGLLQFQSPKNATLFTGLSAQDASAITSKLKELKVSYTLADGGSTILVPKAQQDDLRLQLAGQGLPSGGGVGMVGMEVFDKTNLGVTDFAQHLNFQRALEGELSRTIGRFSAIEQVRVHLVIPEKALFTAQQKDPTAAAEIKLRPGAQLSDDQVQSIKFLVSKSVEGLKPENVAVVDVNGNTLGKTDSPQAALNKVAASHLDVQHQQEQELEKKVQGLLDSVLGANHAVVRASVNLDWSQVQQNIETFSPNGTQPQLRSQHDVRENFSGDNGAIPPAAGVPGTAANIPSYQSQTPGQPSTYQRSDQVNNYEISSDKQSIVRSPGDVKNIGIAVMVDQSVAAAQANQISQAVSAAVGLQPQRGDVVSVVPLPFDNTLATQLRKQQSEQQIMGYVELGAKILGLVIAFAGIFLLFRYLTNSVKPAPSALLTGAAEPTALPGGAAAMLPQATVQMEIDRALAALGHPDVPPKSREEIEAEIRAEVEAQVQAEQQAKRQAEEIARQRELAQQETEQDKAQRERIRDSVAQLALSKPEALAEVLATWLDAHPEKAAGTS